MTSFASPVKISNWTFTGLGLRSFENVLEAIEHKFAYNFNFIQIGADPIMLPVRRFKNP